MSEFNLPSSSYQQPQWYDGGSMYQSTNYDQGMSSSAAAYGSFEEEAPLLEELGIDIPAILNRMRSILLLQLRHRELENLDLGGPLIFLVALGFAHLLVGKLHFGYILGWTVVGSILLWFVLTSMVGPDPDVKNMDVYSCTCTIGYAMLPLVFHAALALLLPRRSTITTVGGGIATVWAALIASTLFSRKSVTLEGQRPLIMYPCILLYTAFALLTLY